MSVSPHLQAHFRSSLYCKTVYMTEYYSVSSTNSAALSSFLAWHLLMSKTKRRQIQIQKKRVPCVPCLHCLPVSRCASSSFWSLFKSTRLKCIKYNIHTCPIKHCKDCEWCPLSFLSMVTSLLDFSLRLSFKCLCHWLCQLKIISSFLVQYGEMAIHINEKV